jgi:hypothetical protein
MIAEKTFTQSYAQERRATQRRKQGTGSIEESRPQIMSRPDLEDARLSFS